MGGCASSPIGRTLSDALEKTISGAFGDKIDVARKRVPSGLSKVTHGLPQDNRETSPEKGGVDPPVKHVMVASDSIPPSSPPREVATPAKRLKLSDLRNATDNFAEANLLGAGNFGGVYQGAVTRKTLGFKEAEAELVKVAVKRLNPASFQGNKEFLSEILVLNSVHHPNLVKLLGHCSERGESLLVYELCPHGSLDKVIQKGIDGDKLPWDRRMQIALDIAKGLTYLHKQNIIHRDLKAGNILVDNNLKAKLCDFGLAKVQSGASNSHVSTKVLGTLGYLDPDYMGTGRLTKGSDVYAFGVVLLELITGRPSMYGTMSLVKWMAKHLTQRRPQVESFIDSELGQNYNANQAGKLTFLAKYCLQEDAESRPDMETLQHGIAKLISQGTQSTTPEGL